MPSFCDILFSRMHQDIRSKPLEESLAFSLSGPQNKSISSSPTLLRGNMCSLSLSLLRTDYEFHMRDSGIVDLVVNTPSVWKLSLR